MSVLEFEQEFRRRLPEGSASHRILIGVSGGADSVALLVASARIELPIVAAHLNHALRDEHSDADEKWVAELCGRLDVSFERDRQDVRTLSESRGLTLEEAARRARYAFFIESARRHDCRYVAVAHTADDQAETVLHHIIRGTSLAGLGGMPTSRELGEGFKLIRPLLQTTREEIEAYLSDLGQDYRNDVTNTDESHTRNRIRHTLLPLLRDQFNPRVNDALLRLSRNASDANQTLIRIAGRLLDEALLEFSAGVCRLDCKPLIGQSRHLVRTLFLELWTRVGWPRQRMGFAEWDRLANLIDESGAVTLPGRIEARRRGELLVLQRPVDDN